MKKTIFIDMDGVIANFAKAAEEGGWKHRPDKHVNYRDLEVMPDASQALRKLNQDFDIFIASTPPWDRPDMWGAKREWVAEHFPYLKRKLILTHRKDLLIGDILIDDSRWRGQPDFKGHWLWFGTAHRCLDWPSTLELIYKRYA
jgi:5'(3')-deoxyribonucleotidase